MGEKVFGVDRKTKCVIFKTASNYLRTDGSSESPIRFLCLFCVKVLDEHALSFLSVTANTERRRRGTLRG